MTAASGGLSPLQLGMAPLASLMTLLAIVQPAKAQLFERALVIENAQIITMAGPVIEKGSLLIRGGRIVAIGENVKAPMFSKRIDASGKTITPGLIDAWSALGNLGGLQKDGATSSAWDNFDVYSDHDVGAALANGVTSIYLTPGSGSGILGMGLVVRLTPQDDGTVGKPMVEEAALAIDLASAKQSIARLKLFSDIRKKFQVALDYQDALELYEEELEEYLEKLEERRKKKEAESEKEESEEDKQDEAEQDKPKDKEADKKEDAEPAPDPDKPKDEPKPKPTPTPKPEDDKHSLFSATMHSLGIDVVAAEEDESQSSTDEEADSEDGKDKDEDEDELEKPDKPKRDPVSEVLIKALDRQVPIRVRADRSSDMLNALELAEEFNLRLTIEGATEAHLLSDRLAEAEVSVVLGPSVRGSAYSKGPFRRHIAANGLALSKAGVDWTIGSGANSSRAARHVGLNAQLASAHGDSSDTWLKLVTADAAKILGVSDQLGKLTRGRSADFVIWDGDPSDPGSKVDRVYVAGKEAFVATGK